MIAQHLIKENPHRHKVVNKYCIFRRLQTLRKVIASWRCCRLRLESEPNAAKVGYVMTARNRHSSASLITNEDHIDGLEFRVPLNLLSLFPIYVCPGLARLGNGNDIRLAGCKLDAQHPVLAKLAISQLRSDLRVGSSARPRLSHGRYYCDTDPDDTGPRPNHCPS
jgi:hypothetical protein